MIPFSTKVTVQIPFLPQSINDSNVEVSSSSCQPIGPDTLQSELQISSSIQPPQSSEEQHVTAPSSDTATIQKPELQISSSIQPPQSSEEQHVTAPSSDTATNQKVLQSHEMERLNITDPQGIVTGDGSEITSSDSHTDTIGSEVNSYFHEMFSGKRTVDDIVYMLARFSKSSVQREQLIFECMVANIIEEYKYLHMYPTKQLGIAAILWGSIIKHHVVTHLGLGIALRAVLEALRKPSNTKMFVFGTTALKQYTDRLVEWPFYCRHIVQIPDLRATHAELVALIEGTLASRN